MEKIELTKLQEELIEKQLRGEYSPFFSTKDEQVAYNEVIDKAQALCDGLNAYDEVGGDLLNWFWGKYQAQEAAAK